MSKENRGKDEVRDQELRTSTFNLSGDMPMWNEWSPWLLAMRPDPQPKPRERNNRLLKFIHRVGGRIIWNPGLLLQGCTPTLCQ